MRYQTIRQNNRIVNATSFGRRLRRFLRKPEQRALLPDGSGWRGQGAWILADALAHWSGKHLRIASLRDSQGRMEHVVASAPALRLFIDADGVAGEIDLMTKMAVVMRTPKVALAHFAPEDARAAGIAYDENIAMELAIRLLHRFGPYRPELLELTGPATREPSSSGLMASIYGRIGLGRIPCPGAMAAVT